MVVPFNATFMDVKNEILRVYRGINPSFAANNDLRYGPDDTLDKLCYHTSTRSPIKLDLFGAHSLHTGCFCISLYRDSLAGQPLLRKKGERIDYRSLKSHDHLKVPVH